MPESSQEGTGPPPPDGKPKEEQVDPQRAPGEPDPKSILYKKPFVSPKGHKYNIIVTDEVDPYEEPHDTGKREPQDGD
jgi:hypothetical protein